MSVVVSRFTLEAGPVRQALRVLRVSGGGNGSGLNDLTGATGATGDVGATGPTGAGLDPGTNYSDYLFWDSATEKWTVGSSYVHLGANAGLNSQTGAVAIGVNAGKTGQGQDGIAIGTSAAAPGQGSSSIAIGSFAAQISPQGSNAICHWHCSGR